MSSSPFAPSDERAPSARSLLWLTVALAGARAFPPDIRQRVGVELVTARHLGLSGSWRLFRGAGPNVFSISVRRESRAATPTLDYRVVCVPVGLDQLICIHAFARMRGKPPHIADKDAAFTRARLKEIALDREERRPLASRRAETVDSSDGVFLALGFHDGEARDLEHRGNLIARARQQLKRQGRICLTHHETRALLDGRIDELSAERLAVVLVS